MTARWQCRIQVRRASDHSLVYMEPSYSGTEGLVAEQISRYLANGCTIERSDSISVTLRSPTLAGRYCYIHFFREGFD